MKENKLRQRALLHISPNCLPVRMPVMKTIIAMMATDVYAVPTFWVWTVSVLLGVVWFYYFTQLIYGMPVDIFEYWRKEESTQDLPIEP